ncbi:uncharacterized protein LTR77_004982 [Saxophila tyrrhenica]|uniref:Fe2OG dioxygenase domain-containing protein n=1 Tax=Saxophila tyrrhenica TaxID=1690608 RepID=A0AAV9PBE2_9PEZI|nr:hypothetical protein LTR77_004982 [Saxophila tyrrhenica]
MEDQPLQDDKAARAQARAERAAAKAQAKADRADERAKYFEEKKNVRSLAEIVENRLLRDLGSSLETHARSATFACGGSLSFKKLKDGQDEEAHEAHTVTATPGENEATAAKTAESSTKSDAQQPAKKNSNTPRANLTKDIQICFGESSKCITVTFSRHGVSAEDLQQLVLACQPAPFGRGGEEVLDEGYRKAGKLDADAFTTSFCPYQAGIVDVIAQLLVPQTAQGKHTRSIKAELYKLNVYSAPAGKFKAHVDTPRSKNQIGSLVVSLPALHKGGELAVRNAGKEMIFDWSSSAKSQTAAKAKVKWAAFYSDCEHEVYEVTSGHRITLTYNVYVTRGIGHLAGAAAALDSQQLPLYQSLKDAVDNPGFLRRGRVLAVWLTHSYAHTNKHQNFLPSSLKGADMSVYNTARALGLKCEVVATMSHDFDYDEDGPSQFVDRTFPGFKQDGSGSAVIGGKKFGYKDINGLVTWLNPERDGKRKKVKEGEEAKPKQQLFREVQTAYMTYGNSPSMAIKYSRAIMLIRIPPYLKRGQEAPESIWEGLKRDLTEEDYEYGDFEDYYGDEDDSYYAESYGAYCSSEDDHDEEDYSSDEEEEDEELGEDAKAGNGEAVGEGSALPQGDGETGGH